MITKPNNTGKIAVADLMGTALGRLTINGSYSIRERLLEIKMARWLLIVKNPFVAPACPPARARRNFWRLIKAHGDTAKRLGYTMTSVYDR